MKFVPKYEFTDFKGIAINYLTPIAEVKERTKSGYIQWLFRCICGKEVILPVAKVMNGCIKSCGCMRYKDIKHKPHNRSNSSKINPEDYIGRKNYKLTVIGYEKPESGGRLKLLCKCDCGNTTLCFPYQFKSGDVKSCGCLPKGKKGKHEWVSNQTHGLTKNRFYKRWNDMIRRCYNTNEPAYKHYGARGISVCHEWRDTPNAFIKWCEKTYPAGNGWSIDRIDVNGDYSPENCRWATQKEQMHNIRNNRNVIVNGVKKCVTDWCAELGVSTGTVYEKVRKGMSFEEAILDSKK